MLTYFSSLPSYNCRGHQLNICPHTSILFQHVAQLQPLPTAPTVPTVRWWWCSSNSGVAMSTNYCDMFWSVQDTTSPPPLYLHGQHRAPTPHATPLIPLLNHIPWHRTYHQQGVRTRHLGQWMNTTAPSIIITDVQRNRGGVEAVFGMPWTGDIINLRPEHLPTLSRSNYTYLK